MTALTLPPTDGDHRQDERLVDYVTGEEWICTKAGNPGSWVQVSAPSGGSVTDRVRFYGAGVSVPDAAVAHSVTFAVGAGSDVDCDIDGTAITIVGGKLHVTAGFYEFAITVYGGAATGFTAMDFYDDFTAGGIFDDSSASANFASVGGQTPNPNVGGGAPFVAGVLGLDLYQSSGGVAALSVGGWISRLGDAP